jgi:hypothetical protein
MEQNHWKITASGNNDREGISSLEIWNEGINAAIGTIQDLSPSLIDPRDGGRFEDRQFTSITLTRDPLPEDLRGTGRHERES